MFQLLQKLVVKFTSDLVDGVTLKREVNAASGEEENVVLEHRDDLHPQVSDH